MRTFLILAIICTVLVALATAGNENLESSLRGEVENKIREKRQLFGGRGGHGGGGFSGGGHGGRGFGGRGFGRGFGGGHGGGYGRRHYG